MRKLQAVFQHILVSALVAALAVGPASASWAGPVQKGNLPPGVTIVPNDPLNPTQWTITAPNGSIIHYSSFDIALGQAVNFVQPGADARVLNRILSGVPTQIDGSLTANGHIYIINPAGVVFGAHATVNATELEAVGGHLSDNDFNHKVDRFTGVKGPVTNAGQIAANAVALVGGQVANSGSVIAEGGWIVMAAGNDVLIGRDSANQGVLLRVEGAANAVFNKNATGVSNTGTLSAGAASDKASGTISLGAGDLYGTAIFSSQAIEARKLALSADNKGDIALGGSVKASELDVTQVGDKTGQLRGIGGAAAPTTINADTVNLDAVSAKGDVRVGAGLAFRDLADDGHGPGTVSVDQQHDLSTANLSGLDLGNHDGVALALNSSAGTLTVTDKKLVNGTDLTLSGTTGVDLQGKDALDVKTLLIGTHTTLSDGDIIARGADPEVKSTDPNAPPSTRPAFEIDGNLEFNTPNVKAGDPSPVVTLLAPDGTLAVKSDITTTNGGTLKLGAQNVELGTFDPLTGAVGGDIDISGSVLPKLVIGFEDPSIGLSLPQRVELTGINTQGAQHHASDPPEPGGDVSIHATGDILVHGAITTAGQSSGKKGVANEPGGRVDIETSGGSITVCSATATPCAVTTGGADAPAAGSTSPEAGAILLSAPNTIDIEGDLDTRGGTEGNASGQRDRSIELANAGTVVLNRDQLTFSGGDVTVAGQLENGTKLDSNENTVPRSVDLTLNASGVTTLAAGAGRTAPAGQDATSAPLHSLTINSTQGKAVGFGGDVDAVDNVTVAFTTDGVASWNALGGAVVNVEANQVVVTSRSGTDAKATSASVALDQNLHFKLDDRVDPNDPNATPALGTFRLNQDAGLDAQTLDQLFSPLRFDSVDGKTIDLESGAAITFDATAASAVQNTNLVLIGQTFSTDSSIDSPLSLRSLNLTAFGALDASFDVTATNAKSGIVMLAGAGGSGDLTVGGSLHADDIQLIASDGPGGGASSKVVVQNSASFRSAAGGDALAVTISQDADLATADLPDPSAFGSSFDSRATPFLYQLQSHDGTVTLSAGQDAKVAGSALSLFGANGIDLGASVPTLASLSALTPGALDVETAIKTKAGGSILLQSGSNLDGTGSNDNLTIGAELDSSTIQLEAGALDGSSSKARVILGQGARFASDADATKAPKSFSLSQDAAIGGNAATAVPDASLFAGSIQGMQLGLSSAGSNVDVKAPQVDGTALTLGGKSVTVSGDLLNLVSLDLTGVSSFDGSVATTGGSLVLNGNTTLSAGTPKTPVPQTLTANGGDFTLTGTLTKSNAGDLTVTSSGKLTVGDVATAHLGDSVTLTGAGAVTTGKIDASGIVNSTLSLGTSRGGDVHVTSTGGDVVVGSVDTRGVAGVDQSKGVAPTPGTNGGSVTITGQTITTGSVTSFGGAGGAPSDTTQETKGGDAGAIKLDGAGGISLSGNLLADGGAGGPNANTASPSALRGKSGDVTLTGPLLLLTDTSAGAAPNEIHGNNVALGGSVGPGTVSGTQLAAAHTGLQVVADATLKLGGNVTAGSVDLELHSGTLALGPRTISADKIRLAASNGVGGDNQGVVDLGGLSFTGSNGTGPVSAFTLDQDASIGGAGSAVPSLSLFAGDGSVRPLPFALGLISENGDVSLDAADVANVNGTALTLAAGPANVAGDSTVHVSVLGQDLDVVSLQLGTTAGANGGPVGGNAHLDRSLRVGSDQAVADAATVLTAIGDLTVDGNARIQGSSQYNGGVDQTISVKGGTLELDGFNTEKTGAGKLFLDVGSTGVIELSGAEQSISSDRGQLEVSTALTKAQGSLLLSGSDDGNSPGVVVHGVNGDGFALETSGGDLSVSSSGPSSSATSGPSVGRIQLDGGASAFGNLSLNGALALQGGQSKYTFQATQNPASASTTTSGVLTVGGIASSDGDVLLQATGPDPSLGNQNPSAILLSGSFKLDHALELDGETEASAATAIEAGDVHFDSRIQGANDLDVTSHGLLQLDDDVAMTAGAFGARGDRGVLFAAGSGDTQTIAAGSIALGNGAQAPAKGTASLVRDGNLVLDASTGGVSVGFGQALVVNGTLNVAATGTATLADTAAKSIAVKAGQLAVYGGSTVQANAISTTAKPSVAGGGSATFAVPTGTEISSNVPSDQIVVRSLSGNGQPIQLSVPPFDPGEFPAVALPNVTGSALFDYARLIPQPVAFQPLTQPHADRIALAAAVESRPLWAEELLAYLEQRSLETPNQPSVPAAELLPPVGARPGELVGANDARVRNAAVENAVALYRELFRPELRRDPETGVVEEPSRTAELRSAFQAPVDALRQRGTAQPVEGAAVAELIESDARFAAAKADHERLTDLLEVGARALSPDQQPRFRALVLADITPHGIAPAEFDRAFR